MRASLIFALERRFSPRLNILKQGRPFSRAAGSLAEMNGHSGGGGSVGRKTTATRNGEGIMNGKQILQWPEILAEEQKNSIIDMN